jgi:hypothetical protein
MYGEDSAYGALKRRRCVPAIRIPSCLQWGGLIPMRCPGQKAGNDFLKQFLMNRDVAASAKSGLEGLQGPLFLLNDKLHANLF